MHPIGVVPQGAQGFRDQPSGIAFATVLRGLAQFSGSRLQLLKNRHHRAAPDGLKPTSVNQLTLGLRTAGERGRDDLAQGVEVEYGHERTEVMPMAHPVHSRTIAQEDAWVGGEEVLRPGRLVHDRAEVLAACPTGHDAPHQTLGRPGRLPPVCPRRLGAVSAREALVLFASSSKSNPAGSTWPSPRTIVAVRPSGKALPTICPPKSPGRVRIVQPQADAIM